LCYGRRTAEPEVLSLWRAATGLTLYEAYGQTETVVLIGNFRSLGHSVRPRLDGQSDAGFTVALLDEHLRELPPGEEGEVAVRVKPRRPLGLFADYWQNAEKSQPTFGATGTSPATGPHATPTATSGSSGARTM